jgi:hypothetical protein
MILNNVNFRFTLIDIICHFAGFPCMNHRAMSSIPGSVMIQSAP